MRLFAAIITILTVFATSVHAEDFSINIKVDVTADDSAQAREKALNGANSAAVVAAAKRITNEDGIAKISELNNDQIINFVKENSVDEEKTPPNRYIANLKVIVNMDLLKQYMRERGIYISSSAIPQILLIPIMNENNTDSSTLWEVSNTWKKAWENTLIESPIVFNVIKDSNNNISTLSSSQAANMDKTALEEIKQFNHVDDIYVLTATYNGIDELNVDISSLSGYRDSIKVNGLKSDENEMLENAVKEIIPIIEKNVLSQQDTPALPQTSEITVLFPFADISDWIAAENKIKAVEQVNSIEVQALSPGKTQFKINYTGELDDLLNGVKSSGYLLEESGNYMILKYIGD